MVVSERENNFNFLRILLATAVVFSHSFPMVGSRAEPLENLVGRQTYAAELAVNGFFAISGLLVTESWLRSRGFWDYLKKRLLRIYPGYLAAALFCLLVAGPLGAASVLHYFHAVRLPQFVREAALLGRLHVPPAFTANPFADSINGSLWTIRIEFECYLLVAALGLAGLIRRKGFIAIAFVAVAALFAALHPGIAANWTTRHVSPAVLDSVAGKIRLVAYFMAGMAFCLYRDRIRFTTSGLWVSLAVTIVAGFLGCLTAVLPITGSYLLFYFAYNPRIRLQRFGSRFDLSYGTYLYAWPVQLLIVQWTANQIGPYALFAAATLVSYALALASWTLVEKPCLRLKRGRTAVVREVSGIVETAPAQSPS